MLSKFARASKCRFQTANHVQPRPARDQNLPGSPPPYARTEIIAKGGEPEYEANHWLAYSTQVTTQLTSHVNMWTGGLR